MKKNKKSKMSKSRILTVGASVAAIGAGAYYFLGPKSKEHRKKASLLMVKMEKELSQKVAKIKSLTKPLYHKAVDALAMEYSKQYKIHEKDIKVLAKRLKGEWQSIANKITKKSLSKKKRP